MLVKISSTICVAGVLAFCTVQNVCADATVASIKASTAVDVAQQRDSYQGLLPLADQVLVRKSERRLYLLRRGQVLRSYPVHLGLEPVGKKQYEGDFRTPEGHYALGKRNPNSLYFLAIQVTYPNETDAARAHRMGLQPGGAIMIHGLPNNPSKPLSYYNRADWTDGCIAVSNPDMVEIWLMTTPGVPIDIEP